MLAGPLPCGSAARTHPPPAARVLASRPRCARTLLWRAGRAFANRSAAGSSAYGEPALPEGDVLRSLRVVLVAPRTPANIGAAARVCANFEARDLWVVAPRCDPRDGEVAKVACGSSVLQRLRVVDSLEQALADTVSSVGFTRRAGATRFTHSNLRQLLSKQPAAISVLNPAAPGGALTALVFGREESGLTEEELRRCSHACAIPTGRVQPSMNLSHAAAVVLSELFAARLDQLELADLGIEVTGSPEAREGLQPAAASEVQSLLAKVSAIAVAVGMSGEDSRGGGAKGSHGRRRLPLGHMRAILARAQASTWEVRSLHGLAAAILGRVQLVTSQPAAEQLPAEGSQQVGQ